MLVAFWICLGIVAYTYVGYPILLGVVGLFKRGGWRQAPFQGSFSFVLSVHNEEGNIARRLEELSRLVRESGLKGEVILVSDGSTDRTVELARALETDGIVRVLERAEKEGKAAALTVGCAAATGDILVFADARQRWADDALAKLLENFADVRVGAVSGDLMLETAAGVMAGVGLYWRYEKWLRKKESHIHAQVGVTGAISACRRYLFPGVPTGTLCDDVYWPLRVAMQRYRVVHDERAHAFDRLPDKPQDEFRRKVRTQAGVYQVLRLLPGSLLPWRNPVWVQWVSHKLLRLASPWALLALFFLNGLLVAWHPPAWVLGGGETEFWRDVFFPGFLGLQALGYVVGLAGLSGTIGSRVKLAGAAGSLLVLNAAAFVAFWVWVSGRAGKAWSKVTYRAEAVDAG